MPGLIVTDVGPEGSALTPFAVPVLGGVAVGAPPVVALGSAMLAVGASATARPALPDSAGTAAVVCGAFGPRRTPAIRGQATPTAKPITATTPMRNHCGWSCVGSGMETVRRSTFFTRDDGVLPCALAWVKNVGDGS